MNALRLMFWITNLLMYLKNAFTPSWSSWQNQREPSWQDIAFSRSEALLAKKDLWSPSTFTASFWRSGCFSQAAKRICMFSSSAALLCNRWSFEKMVSQVFASAFSGNSQVSLLSDADIGVPGRPYPRLGLGLFANSHCASQWRRIAKIIASLVIFSFTSKSCSCILVFNSREDKEDKPLVGSCGLRTPRICSLKRCLSSGFVIVPVFLTTSCKASSRSAFKEGIGGADLPSHNNGGPWDQQRGQTWLLWDIFRDNRLQENLRVNYKPKTVVEQASHQAQGKKNSRLPRKWHGWDMKLTQKCWRKFVFKSS